MSKSTTQQIVYASRIVNALDVRGKLVILRDLQAQGLEQKAMDRVIAVGQANTGATIEKISTVTNAKVPVTYTEGTEK